MSTLNLTKTHHMALTGGDYLEAIYDVSTARQETSVRSVDIARSLGVAKPTAHVALTSLREEQLVTQTPYGRVALTPAGAEMARELERFCKAMRIFLANELGTDKETAHEEAGLMEHALSRETMRKWTALLGGS